MHQRLNIEGNMKMMGYTDGGGDLNALPDSFNGRKLRPLIPRPFNPSTIVTPPCLSHIQNTDFFALSHHFATMGSGDHQNKKELFNTQPVVVVSPSRWNPTPEQLRALEELYRRGTRTPSADQIQSITAQLRRYGKIEGKNVFYWFQNHKARERQKRRRQSELLTTSSEHTQQHYIIDHVENFGRKEIIGANKTNFEIEETKNWAPPTNCSTLAEECGSVGRGRKVGLTEGWTHEGEIEHIERNGRWQIPTFFMNTTITTTPNNTPTPTSKPVMRSILITPYTDIINSNEEEEEKCGESDQTLPLFPLRSEDEGNQERNHNRNRNSTEGDINIEMSLSEDTNIMTSPNYQFFEFLPLLNK